MANRTFPSPSALARRFSALTPRFTFLTFQGETASESTRMLARWLFFGTLIGLVAGLGAIVFTHAIQWCTELFLGRIVGYMPPGPIGEGSPVQEAMDRPWLLPIVTMLGGLISGVIVYRLAPEAEGHGTDAAIEAIHFKQGDVKPRIPPIKLIASAITIGSGGSGGREGPAAQISSGFGSVMAKWFGLGTEERQMAVAVGMGSGIGAIFRAPLGGALMASEILYIHDMEVGVLIPGLIASIVGYSLYGYIEGWDPIFGAQPGLGFSDPITLVWYAGLGLLCGLVGLLYSTSFYGMHNLFHRLNVPRMIKPAIGGLLVGLMGIAIKGSIHTGYGWVQIAMSRELMSLPLWMVIALPFAKILATSFSIGSGGSGGIFGPGLVIGGMLGATAWRLGDGVLPHMPASSAPFVIIGMVALFGAVAHAPFAVMLMVAEMTGNLSLLAPAMIAIAVATIVVGDQTIYRAQLPDRSFSPMHRLKMSFPLLSALTARDAVKLGRTAPVAAPAGLTVDIDTSLVEVIELMSTHGAASAVVTDKGQPVGELAMRDVIGAYKRMLARGVRRAEAMPTSSMIVDYRVSPRSWVAGKALRDARLPQEALVVAIMREGRAIFPTADSVLNPDDVVSVLLPSEVRPRVRAVFGPGSNETVEASTVHIARPPG